MNHDRKCNNLYPITIATFIYKFHILNVTTIIRQKVVFHISYKLIQIWNAVCNCVIDENSNRLNDTFEFHNAE